MQGGSRQNQGTSKIETSEAFKIIIDHQQGQTRKIVQQEKSSKKKFLKDLREKSPTKYKTLRKMCPKK